jgi:hypothetical protein
MALKGESMNFTTDMFVAIRDGRKTQARRPVQPPREVAPRIGDSPYRCGENIIVLDEALGTVQVRITDVRIEQVREISEDDAEAEFWGGDIPHNVMPEFMADRICRVCEPCYDAEGVLTAPGECACGGYSVEELWREIWLYFYGSISWERNDWVWAYTFEVVP